MSTDLTLEELEFLASCFDLAREGDVEQLDELFDQGLPLNLTNDSGDTLLILAAYYRQLPVVQTLLAHGADTSRVNDRGQTALASAVFRQDEPIVRALLAAGADPALGAKSAYTIADYFELPAMRALLDEASAGAAVPALDQA